MIVIPMAGQSSRFSSAGYPVPKYELLLKGRPVFDYAVASFRELFDKERFLFVIKEVSEARNFVSSRAATLGLGQFDVVCLAEETGGQAETVAKGLQKLEIPSSESVTIFNIDTFRPGFEMSSLDRQYCGFVEVFEGLGEQWSFVQPRPDSENLAKRVVEKERVSNLCCTGLYYFATKDLFLSAYLDEQNDPSQEINESYVAPLYNQLIRRGLEVGYRTVGFENVFFCGVPAEYEGLRRDDVVCERLKIALGL